MYSALPLKTSAFSSLEHWKVLWWRQSSLWLILVILQEPLEVLRLASGYLPFAPDCQSMGQIWSHYGACVVSPDMTISGLSKVKESKVGTPGWFYGSMLPFSPLNKCLEIPKRNQPWIFIGRTNGEAESPILWPPDAEIWLIGKDPDAGKDWRREEKWVAENEMDM